MNTHIDANRKWIFNGYIPIKNKQMNESMINIPIEHANQSAADPGKLKALEGIIQLCKNKNVKLYFINSPYFHIPRKSLKPLQYPQNKLLK